MYNWYSGINIPLSFFPDLSKFNISFLKTFSNSFTLSNTRKKTSNLLFIGKRKSVSNKRDVSKKKLVKYLCLDENKYTSNDIDVKIVKDIFGKNCLKYNNFFDFVVSEGIQSIRNVFKHICKNNYVFENAMQYAWQEVFKFKEIRENRSVIVLDVNSQFPAVMCENGYSDVSNIRYIKNPNIGDIAFIKNGVMLVSFDINDEWFASVFPHYFFDVEGRKYFNCKEFSHIWLSVSEFNAYKRYFTNIHIKRVYFSDKDFYHPLKTKVNKLYAFRKTFKGSVYEKIIKNFLVGLHSCSNPREFVPFNKSLDYNNISVIKTLYSCGFIINSEKDIEYINDRFLRHKRTNRFIPSLGCEIYAKSRINIFKLMEFLHDHYKDSVDLCYTNIDSLHISVCNSVKDKLLKDLEVSGFIDRDTMGKFKIECVGTSGYWFCPGRYFILAGNKVVKYGNISIKNKMFLFNFKQDLYRNETGLLAKSTHTAVSGNNYKYIDENFNFVRPKWKHFIDLDQYNHKNRLITDALNLLKINFCHDFPE